MAILIVDDSRVVRLHLHSVLRKAGYGDVIEAESAAEAFALLQLSDSPSTAASGVRTADAPAAIDLILLDGVMPDVDGVEVCRRIKSAPHLRDVPVIMVTAQTETSKLAAAFAAGAMDYITKPSKDAELLARVRSALTLKRETDRRKAREQELLDLTAKLEEANQRLERLSSLDGLTGIPNRRRFDEYLRSAWAEAAQSGTPLSLLLVDIDHFKPYNDNYGHQQGDECLKRVAGAIHQSVSHAGDLAARYGGEEFVVVLPNATRTRASLVGETLRARVRGLNIPHAHSSASAQVSVSVGAATAWPAQGSSPAEMIEQADEALYMAKRAGRNRVVFHDARVAADLALEPGLVGAR
jgi:diguanylate cyclase (GGDEF)-like protein